MTKRTEKQTDNTARPDEIKRRVESVLTIIQPPLPDDARSMVISTVAMMALRPNPIRRPLPESCLPHPEEDQELSLALQTVIRISNIKAIRMRNDVAEFPDLSDEAKLFFNDLIKRLGMLASYSKIFLPPESSMPEPRRRGRPRSDISKTVDTLAIAIRVAFYDAGRAPPGFNGEATVGARIVTELLAILDGKPRSPASIRAVLRLLNPTSPD